MSYEVAQVLQDAAEVLERDGWDQGEYVTANGYCALGALGKATDELKPSAFTGKLVFAGAMSDNPAASAATLAFLESMGWCDHDEVPDWNDAPGRTKQEVIDAFHLAAKQEMRKADGLIE